MSRGAVKARRAKPKHVGVIYVDERLAIGWMPAKEGVSPVRVMCDRRFTGADLVAELRRAADVLEAEGVI